LSRHIRQVETPYSVGFSWHIAYEIFFRLASIFP
jgi:hypothetical protein